jgi:hypothetical protein
MRRASWQHAYLSLPDMNRRHRPAKHSLRLLCLLLCPLQICD